MDREELASWLRLELTPGVGNATARRLLAAFGLPQQIFSASPHALEQVVSAQQSTALQSTPPGLADLLEATWQWLAESPMQRRVMTLGDAIYPPSLLNMEDPPLLLYGMGAEQVWSHGGLGQHVARSLAVVGSRNPTPQGAISGSSHGMAQVGLTIVGLALGWMAPHRVRWTGPRRQLATIAVGAGLDRSTPGTAI
jgi:DNA processing protein